MVALAHLLAKRLKISNANREDGRLRILRVVKDLGRAIEADVAQREIEHTVCLVKYSARSGRANIYVMAHAYKLGPLSREYEACFHVTFTCCRLSVLLLTTYLRKTMKSVADLCRVPSGCLRLCASILTIYAAVHRPSSIVY